MSNQIQTTPQNKPQKLPTIKELVEETAISIKENNLMVLLNQPPPEAWIKIHPFIKGYRYLPIGRIEYLLKRIFTNYKISVLKTGILFNAIEVTVRIEYRNPVTHEWCYHDGVGACELQTMKDTGTLKLDMSNVNKSAVEMALPIAKSKAIKDACDHFGRLFGSDLNHKEQFNFNDLMKDPSSIESINDKKEYERIIAHIATATDLDELLMIPDEIIERHNLTALFTAKKESFNGTNTI